MRLKIAVAAFLVVARGAFALSVHDGILSGAYVVTASAPILLTPDEDFTIPLLNGHWPNPFKLLSLPMDIQIITITLPDVLVLKGLAEGKHGESLRDQRILARDLGLGSVAFFIGATIVLNAVLGESHGAELVFIPAFLALETGLLTLPALFPFDAEYRRGSSGDPAEAAALQVPATPLLSLRIPF